jgi:hypothetical protein
MSAGNDECARAADIYQCGREKAPDVTNALQNELTPSSTVFTVFFLLGCIQNV